MRYFTVAFLTKETTGTDVLGNPVTEWLTAKTWVSVVFQPCQFIPLCCGVRLFRLIQHSLVTM